MREKDDIVKEVAVIMRHLEANLPSEAPLLIQELDQCNVWLARVSQLCADAQYYLDQRRGEYSEQQASLPKQDQISATLFREQINKYVAIEQRTVNMADRLASTLRLRIETIRSILSYEKVLASA